MHKGTNEYKRWLEQRNKKNLRKRSKKKKKSRLQSQAKTDYVKHLKKVNKYNEKERRFEFIAPLVFSLTDNPDETIQFFNKIIRFITDKRNFGNHLFIDISKITYLSSDALMYLLAIVNNLNGEFRDKYNFSGNTPTNETIKKAFTESGFYEFVRYRGNDLITRNNNNLQIVSGEKYDTELAKRISDFVCEKAGVEVRYCSFLYNIMIELMDNAHKHAYNDEGLLLPRWYCFAKYDNSTRDIYFTFMDTGSGIPATVQKKITEKANIISSVEENKFVISALKGEFRTATKQVYRGKGLPKIREFCTTGKIRDMHIMTNRADVMVSKESLVGRDMEKPIHGTLYRWSINIDELKGEQV